jgi:hypothetical protein
VAHGHLFAILRHFLFKGDGTTKYGYDFHTIRCYLTYETSIYGLGWESTVFKIFGHFLYQGDETTPFCHDLYTIRCSLTQKTGIWFRGEDLNSFQNIWALPV